MDVEGTTSEAACTQKEKREESRIESNDVPRSSSTAELEFFTRLLGPDNVIDPKAQPDTSGDPGKNLSGGLGYNYMQFALLGMVANILVKFTMIIIRLIIFTPAIGTGGICVSA